MTGCCLVRQACLSRGASVQCAVRSKSLISYEAFLTGPSSNVEAHKARRKLFSRGFSQATMNEFEPKISAKLEVLFDQLSRHAKEGKAVNVQPWVIWFSFDTVCKRPFSNCETCPMLTRVEDHLLFGADPATLNSGNENKLLTYLRAWRPTFIYVCAFMSSTHLPATMTYWLTCSRTERVLSPDGESWCKGSRADWRPLPSCARVENCKRFCHAPHVGSIYSQLMFSNL